MKAQIYIDVTYGEDSHALGRRCDIGQIEFWFVC